MEIFLIIVLLFAGGGGGFLGWKKYNELKSESEQKIKGLEAENRRRDTLVNESKTYKARVSELETEKKQLAQSRDAEIREIEKEKKQISVRLSEQMKNYAADLSDRAKDYEDKLIEQQKEHNDRLSTREKRHEERLDEQRRNYQTKLDERENRHETKLENQKQIYETRLLEWEKKHGNKVDDYEAKLSEQKKDYKERLSSQQRGYEERLSDQRQGYESKLERRRKDYAEHIENLTTEYEEKIAAMVKEYNENYSDILGFCKRTFKEIVELAFRYRPPLDRNKEKFLANFRHLTSMEEFDADLLEPEAQKLGEYIYLMGNERLLALSKTSDMGLKDFVNVFTDRISETNVENLGEDDKKRYIVFFNTLEDFLKPIEKRVTHFDRLPHENQRLLVLSDLRRLYRDQIIQVNKDFEEELITDEEKDNAVDMIEEFRDLEISKIRSTIEMA